MDNGGISFDKADCHDNHVGGSYRRGFFPECIMAANNRQSFFPFVCMGHCYGQPMDTRLEAVCSQAVGCCIGDSNTL